MLHRDKLFPVWWQILRVFGQCGRHRLHSACCHSWESPFTNFPTQAAYSSLLVLLQGFKIFLKCLCKWIVRHWDANPAGYTASLFVWITATVQALLYPELVFQNFIFLKLNMHIQQARGESCFVWWASFGRIYPVHAVWCALTVLCAWNLFCWRCVKNL